MSVKNNALLCTTDRALRLVEKLVNHLKKKGSHRVLSENLTDLKWSKVEPTGLEPVSKHIRRKLSTCLFVH